ncbi:TFP11 domain-containing protein [Chloropicon primus]|uniref:TFP11 domain-containing protein n=2 Tax=Chloropicon primus TaxID=1764295 RepID=A0A5B8MJX7_9CHLO|nr:TFP11 domain-containing protein [Chloropicon primus]|eukprot:QDZ19662.1 TFP11 domain-containing protein [Chloropicon primus]
MSSDEDVSSSSSLLDEDCDDVLLSKRRRTRDPFFHDEEEDDDEDQHQHHRDGHYGGRRKRRRGKDSGRTKSDYSKPVGFVSGGVSATNSNRVVAAAMRDSETASRSAGLGFGGEGEEAPRGGLGGLGMPSSFGEAATAASPLASRRGGRRVARDPAEDIGTFEKHTKGIGMKLLKKMGYQIGKGLGKGNKGIAAPVEAKLRPKGMGMGFGEPQEMPKKKEPQAKAKAAKTRVQPPPQAQLWKKSKKAVREKVAYKTVEDVRKETQGVVHNIIDMRGLESETTPMPELQYNMRLVVDNARCKLQALEHEILQQTETAENYREKISRIESSRVESGASFERLREMSQTISPLVSGKENIRTLENVEGVLDDLGSLKEKFPSEFAAYRVAVIASSLVYKPLENRAKAWKPLEECQDLKSALEKSKSVLHDGGDLGMDPYAVLLKETICFQLNRYVCHQWDPTNPDEVILFLDQWAKVFPSSSRAHILDEMVLPRLRTAVDDWQPSAGSVPLHVWIHPWLPYLSDQLQELYPAVRQKLSKALRTWKPSETMDALPMLKAWKPVFGTKAWDKFTSAVVMPKLEGALAGLEIDPKNKPDTSRLVRVIGWSDIVSHRMMCAMLRELFFPKLLQSLFTWLTGNPEFDEVVEWYEGWKGMFPEELGAQEDVRVSFNKCLLMMNAAVSGEDLSPYDPSKDKLQRERGRKAPASEQQNRAEFHATLKDLVENFCIESGVEFLPKVGRFNNSLQVYSFGGISVTLDNSRQVIEARIQGEWVAVSLERLLAESKRQM